VAIRTDGRLFLVAPRCNLLYIKNLIAAKAPTHVNKQGAIFNTQFMDTINIHLKIW
jgi:uncharacterized C2H2 Zn-finger protein